MYAALYLYDNLMIGESAVIFEAVELLPKNRPVLKVVDGLQGYLSCEISCSEGKKKAWLEQSYLFENLEKKFGERAMWVWSPKAQSTSRFVIVRLVNDEKCALKTKNYFGPVFGC